MKTVTIVIQNAPYRSNNKAWHALRFAGAVLADDMGVRVHLLDDGVESVKVSRDPDKAVVVYDDAETSPEELIKVVVNAGYDATIITAQ
jgi:sulfur relay (sulfurtransferase) complex TusBCD TusD component (DsrE family)